MHKCIGHHQKAIAKARGPDTTDPSHLDEWKLLFTMVNALWEHRATLGEAEFLRQRGHLEGWLDRLLAEPRLQPGDVAVQQRIDKRRGWCWVAWTIRRRSRRTTERSGRWTILG